MPSGPKDQERAADVINAISVPKTAVSETEEAPESLEASKANADDERTHSAHQNAYTGQSSKWPTLKPDSIDPEAEEAKHRAAERRFWERQIRLAKWLNWITGAGAAAGIAGLVILYFTLKAADDATVEANRAWIKPFAPEIGWDQNSSRLPGIFSVAFPYINNGKSPAFEIREYHEPFKVSVKSGEIPYTVKNVPPNTTCEKTNNDLAGQAGVSWPLIPDFTGRYIFGRSSITIGDDFSNGQNLFGLQGCYKYRTFKQIRYSRYCYILVPNYHLDHRIVSPDQWSWKECPGAIENDAD